MESVAICNGRMVDELAVMEHVSPSHLHRYATDYTLEHSAQTIGYALPFFLSHIFKRYASCSPQAFCWARKE